MKYSNAITKILKEYTELNDDLLSEDQAKCVDLVEDVKRFIELVKNKKVNTWIVLESENFEQYNSILFTHNFFNADSMKFQKLEKDEYIFCKAMLEVSKDE